MKYDLMKTSLPNWNITIELSNKFSELLTKSLGKEIVINIINKNKIDIFNCASHEYCDSNEFMIESLNHLFGDRWSLSDNRIINLINDSWELSITNEYKQFIIN